MLYKTGTITSGFEGKKRKYHFLKNRAILWYALSRAVHKNRTSQVWFSPSKPDLIRPKNTYLIVIGFLQAFIEPWEPNDRLHGIPGHDPARESRKTPLEGGRKSVQRERHPKFEITLIRKTRTSSSDFALKFISYPLKTGTTSSQKQNLRCDTLSPQKHILHCFFASSDKKCPIFSRHSNQLS